MLHILKDDSTSAYLGNNVIANPELLISTVPKRVSRERPSVIDSTHGINKTVGCPGSIDIISVNESVTVLEGNSRNLPQCTSCSLRRRRKTFPCGI
jgi:hypothetical protein